MSKDGPLCLAGSSEESPRGGEDRRDTETPVYFAEYRKEN